MDGTNLLRVEQISSNKKSLEWMSGEIKCTNPIYSNDNSTVLTNGENLARYIHNHNKQHHQASQCIPLSGTDQIQQNEILCEKMPSPSSNWETTDDIDSDEEPIRNLFAKESDILNENVEEEFENEELIDENSSDEETKILNTKNPELQDFKSRKAEERVLLAEDKAAFDEDIEARALTRLKFLLEKTTLYSNFLSQNLRLPPSSHSIIPNGEVSSLPESTGKHKLATRDGLDKSENTSDHSKAKHTNHNGNRMKRQKADTNSACLLAQGKDILRENYSNVSSSTEFKQPVLITGGKLRAYQLQGVEWLVSLYENGLNGILADEMGLGKTIQCIALFSHLIYMGVSGPFLVVAPLSTLSNWIREFQRWTPSIPVLLYHGTKAEREILRKTKLVRTKKNSFPVIVTSYQIVMKDRKYLQKYSWKYIVIDEGHRIKNLNCKLLRELKSYQSANRLLLTGTPLQNNLKELWSMLNFLLPDVFDDLESFQSWFDFTSIGDKEGDRNIIAREEQNQIIAKLHQILRPFLLRRVKTDVEIELPRKQERIISTPLSPLQATFYRAILNKSLPSLLTEEAKRRMRNTGSSLQNLLMQLRKCCNHPFLFEWPVDSQGRDIIDRSLVTASGKMQVLDRMLPRLKKEGHKVLIFSQMTKLLDIIEDYMVLQQYKYCRIDGSTLQPDRERHIQTFNNDTQCFCFLLSTRAGGLGINLTAADTVIFYDNDWNPQMDLQAQDRCHRIGQTKPVHVYRFASANSIESRILERQASKMKLDRIVIQKGNFMGVQSRSSINKISELEELLNAETPSIAGNIVELTDQMLFDWDDSNSF